MSKSASDLCRSLRVIRRYGILIGITAAVGLLAGAAVAAVIPAMVTSTALVVLPQAGQSVAAAARGEPGPFTATQEVVAGSDQVLSDALADARPAMSLTQLRHDIQIGSPASDIISVNAESRTAAGAEATANAVARSYIQYTSSAGHVPAVILESATSAIGTAPLLRLLAGAMLGTVSGALTGVIAAVVSRRLTLGRLPSGGGIVPLLPGSLRVLFLSRIRFIR